MKGGKKEDGTPKGLHTSKGENRIAEGFGPKQYFGEFGCYKQKVRIIGEPTKIKADESTFFPDSWSLEDIRMAIEYASSRKNMFEVMAPEKGAGMMLYGNAEGYYPDSRNADFRDQL